MGWLCQNLPFRNQQNEIIGVIGNSVDITKRKKAEENTLSLEKEKALSNCRKDKTKPTDILTKEAMGLLAERLITPLQITYYLTCAMEKGFQIGEKPISVETVKSVLAPDLNALEPNLARQGYNIPTLCAYLNAKRHEVKAYLRGQLSPSRFEELNKDVQKLGIIL